MTYYNMNEESAKFIEFKAALTKLLTEYNFEITTSGYEVLQIWNKDLKSRDCLEHLEDRTNE